MNLTPGTVRLAAASVYVAALLVGVGLTRLVRPRLRRYCYPFLLVLAVEPASLWAQATGFGAVSAPGGSVNLFQNAIDLVNFTVIYGGAAALAGASRRLVGTTVAAAISPLLGLFAASFVGGSGALTTLVLAAVVVPYPVLVYLFLRPLRRAAEGVSIRQRLLHLKARNVLLFGYAATLVVVFLAVGGVVTDPVLSAALVEYTSLFSVAGVPIFVVYSLTGLDTDLGLRLGATVN